MKICSPEGQAVSEKLLQAVSRPERLQGLRIGFLDNTKAPVDKMLAHIDKRLQERLPGIRTFHASKSSMAVPATAQVMGELRANADVLINALGD